MSIAPETIEAVKARIEIDEVVGDYVSLKKKGQNLWACCPFHDEKTPSFSVAPNKGLYKCFGCGQAGDAIKFVMDYEGMTYPEAIRQLANKYGIPIEEEEQTPEQVVAQNERESLQIVLKFAQEWYAKTLWETQEGKSIGLSYFKERGFTESVIKNFGLGYAPDSWTPLTTAARKQGYSDDMLEKAGLLIRKEGGKEYDRFRGRVIFPIHNVAGKPIAFGARILKKDKNSPKYLNSPETELYHKSDVLYGISQAKQKIRNQDNCYLVEGYTDVVSLHMAGITNVVASSGTSLTVEQIKLVKRFTKNITVLYDGDTAGIKASLRGVDMILSEGMAVKVVIFPEGEDPDSYAQNHSSTEVEEFLTASAQDFLTFKTQLYAEESATDPIRRAQTIREIVESIAKIPDPIVRSVYIKQSASELDMDEDILIAELNKIIIKESRDRQKQAQKELDRKRRRADPPPFPMDGPPPMDDPYPMDGPPPLDGPPPMDDPSLMEAPPLMEGDVVDMDLLLDLEEAGVSPAKPSLITLQERESVRLLLSYGHRNIEEEYHLCQYMLEELEGIKFTHPVYIRIFEEYRRNLEQGRVIDGKWLVQNGPEDLKKDVADLMMDKYEVSNNWFDRYQIYVPHEKDLLEDVVLTNILRFKFRAVQELIKVNMNELKKTPDPEKQMELMGIHQSLKKSEMEFAKLLGIVISG